jgi:hypothetical protein
MKSLNNGIVPEHFYNNARTVSINGPIQSGKTSYLLLFVLLSIVNNVKCIVVVNSNEMKMNIMEKIDRLNGELSKTEPLIKCGFKFIDWLNDCLINCLIVLGNKVQLEKVQNNTQDVRFNIFYDCDTPEISITPFKSFHVNKKTCQVNVNVKKHPNYKGIESLNIKNTSGLSEMIKTISLDNGPKTFNHPYICISKLQKNKQNDFIDNLQKNHPNQWLIVQVQKPSCLVIHHHMYGKKEFNGSITKMLNNFSIHFGVKIIPKILILTPLIVQGLDYQSCSWHITDQYEESKKSSSFNILGIYNDDVSLDLWFKK